MFTPRPPGYTQRRDAFLNPHGNWERFDPEFPIQMICTDCGKSTWSPRKHMSEAMKEHRRSYCDARKTKQDEPHMMRVLYPRSKE